MSQTTTVLVKNLSSKATEDILVRLFSAYGTIQKTNLIAESNLAEITFSTHDEALSAIDKMNDKEIIKNKVSVVLAGAGCDEKSDDNSSSEPKFEMDKESVGALVFPLAKRKYASHASKITGMIVESIVGLKEDPFMPKIVKSEKTLMELVEAAYKKIVLFTSEPILKIFRGHSHTKTSLLLEDKRTTHTMFLYKLKVKVTGLHELD
jgi:RNA recognition motif-containing protein